MQCTMSYLFYSISTVIWLSLVIGSSLLILPAILLSLSALCNSVAVCKREEPTQRYHFHFNSSKVVGGAGLAASLV